jgi:hypothetical protein
MQMHSNDNAREGRPSLWIFKGKSVVLLVIGAGVFIALFRMLDAAGVDWPLNIALSILPLLVTTAYVWRFVNGKPSSYAWDLLMFAIWRSKSWLYLNGALDRPPALWIRARLPRHPSEFTSEVEV